MALKITPFRPHHLRLMDLREWDRKLMAASPAMSMIAVEAFVANGIGWTATAPEGVVGAAGIVRIYRGTYEAWAYTTPLFEKYGIEIHRTAKHILDDQFALPHVNRIQCVVDTLHPAAVRWAGALGFKLESFLKMYGPDGQDFIMYARTKNKWLSFQQQ